VLYSHVQAGAGSEQEGAAGQLVEQIQASIHSILQILFILLCFFLQAGAGSEQEGAAGQLVECRQASIPHGLHLCHHVLTISCPQQRLFFLQAGAGSEQEGAAGQVSE
jgi:hypothetical protein